MNPEPPGTQNRFWMPTVVFDESTGITTERLTAAFASENIDARVFFHPLSTIPPFAGSSLDSKWAGVIPNRAINIPSFHDIAETEERRIVQVIQEICVA